MKSKISQQAVSSFKRLLLSRPDRIGDVVITTSCLKVIHDVYPDLEIYFLVNEPLIPLLSDHPLLSGIISLPDRSENPNHSIPFLRDKILNLNPDCIIHFNHDPIVAAAAYKANIPYRLGHRQKKHNAWLTHTIPDRRKEGLQHEAEYNLDLLNPLHISPPHKLEPWLSPEPINDARLLELLPWWRSNCPFAVFHISAHASKARIPANIFAGLTPWLIDELDYHLVLIGSESDDPAKKSFLKLIGNRLSEKVSDLTGITHLGETARVLNEARFLLSRDSGPAHLATAVNCPAVTLIGPLGRKLASTRWRPLGSSAKIIEKPLSPRLWETTRAYHQRYFNAFSVEEIKNELTAVINGAEVNS